MEVNSNAHIEVGSRSVMIAEGGQPSAPKKRRRVARLSEELEYWGDDNLEPQHLLKDIKSNAVLRNALNWSVRALYSGGVEYGYLEGEDQMAIQRIDKIEEFLQRSRIADQLVRGLMGFKLLGNAFPEYILSRDRKTITRISYLDSSQCRWGKYSANSGYSRCYVSASWDYYRGRLNDEYTIQVPTIDIDGWGQESYWLKEVKGYKYILPDVCFPSLGNSYYADPAWTSIRESGWLTYANQIPKFKESYLKNASHIKYAVHVPESWWLWKYPDWEELTPEERKKLRIDEHKRFDKFLVGVENAGRSIMMTFRDNADFKAQGYTKWEIQVIDKKVIEGILTDDVLETTQMIHNAVGVHGTLVGSSPGSKLGAGSGSDQKQAYNIFMALSQADQDILLRPLEIAAEYNGFKGLKFRIRNRLIADLKDITPSKREVQDAI